MMLLFGTSGSMKAMGIAAEVTEKTIADALEKGGINMATDAGKQLASETFAALVRTAGMDVEKTLSIQLSKDALTNLTRSLNGLEKFGVATADIAKLNPETLASLTTKNINQMGYTEFKGFLER